MTTPNNAMRHVTAQAQAQLYLAIMLAWSAAVSADPEGEVQSEYVEEAKNAIYLMRESGVVQL